MARRKAAKPETGFKVEAFATGAWLWVLLPNFPTIEAAQAWIDAKTARDRTPMEYRIVPAGRG